MPSYKVLSNVDHAAIVLESYGETRTVAIDPVTNKAKTVPPYTYWPIPLARVPTGVRRDIDQAVELANHICELVNNWPLPDVEPSVDFSEL